ncbi:hypothetical protein Droror1_Dr00004088 [Drosera rotundifolia]
MDLSATTCPLKSPPSDRLTTLFTQPSGPTSPLLSSSPVELTEHDIFDDDADSSPVHHVSSSSPSTSSSPSPITKPLNRTASNGFDRASSFGILVALPEEESDSRSPNPNNSSILKPTASPSLSKSSSSSSVSAARMIPPVPKRKETAAGAGAGRYYQSAPVRVPMMERRRGKFRVRDGGFGYEEVEEEEEEKEDEDEVKGKGMLPPHEIVARKEARTPVVSCSVLEGAGRTLKGRDLRMVRNAVFRRTGFID